jgi:CHAT domain-containing protein
MTRCAIALFVILGIAARAQDAQPEQAIADLVKRVDAAASEADARKMLEDSQALFAPTLVSALVDLGDQRLDVGMAERSARLFAMASTVATEIHDQRGLASALRGAGDLLVYQSKPEQAAAVLEQSRAIEEKIGDQPGLATVLNAIGNMHFAQGEMAQTLSYFRQALKIREQTNDRAGTGKELNNVGVAVWKQGDCLAAIGYFDRSADILRELGLRARLATSLQNIGLCHWTQGDYSEALTSLNEALDIVRELKDPTRTAAVQNALGIVYRAQGHYEQSLAAFEEALSIRKRVDQKWGVAETLDNLGLLYQSEANREKALDSFEQGLAINRQLGNREILSDSQLAIGRLYRESGEYEKAFEHYQRSLEASAGGGISWQHAETLREVGELRLDQGRYQEARKFFEQALAAQQSSGDKAASARTLTAIAALELKLHRYAEALKDAGRARQLGEAAGNPEVMWAADTASGRALRSLGRTSEARAAFDRAIALVEQLRTHITSGNEAAGQFLFDKLAPYDQMVSLLVAAKQPEEALNYAERAKARVLVDVLRGGAGITNTMTESERAQEKHLIAQLNSWNEQIGVAETQNRDGGKRLAALDAKLAHSRVELDSFEDSLYAAHPELKVSRGRFAPLTQHDLDALPPAPSGRLLEYVSTDQTTYLFSAARGRSGAPRLAVFDLKLPRKRLEQEADTLQRELADRDLRFAQQAQEADRLLLPPGAIAGARELVIVPDGALWNVPFQALRSSSGRYLIQDCAIAYAPSLAALREMSKPPVRTRPAKGMLLALGNPPAGAEPPLPDAERQVDDLEKLYGASRSAVFVGAQAREDRLKREAGNYRVVHVATHAFLDHSNPMYSYLLLAPGGSEDGRLEAWEISHLNLNADLVVLSACETGRGQIVAGEGVIGLAWSFFVAGSPRLVTSLWNVDAASTTDLMLDFHKQLAAEYRGGQRIRVAEALRTAVLATLARPQYAHPYYWAGFVVAGNGF